MRPRSFSGHLCLRRPQRAWTSTLDWLQSNTMRKCTSPRSGMGRNFVACIARCEAYDQQGAFSVTASICIVKGILPIAIALGFVLRESYQDDSVARGAEETWSTETRPSGKEPLQREWIYNDQRGCTCSRDRGGDEPFHQTGGYRNIAWDWPQAGVSYSASGLTEFSRESGAAMPPTHEPLPSRLGVSARNCATSEEVRHLHLFVAIPVELAVLIGHQLNALCPITVYEFTIVRESTSQLLHSGNRVPGLVPAV